MDKEVIPEIEKEIPGMQILDHIHAQYSHKIQDVDFKILNQHHRFLRLQPCLKSIK